MSWFGKLKNRPRPASNGMDENKTQPNLNNKDIKVLRTYTSDMAEAVRTNEVSVIKIALAEKEKREQEDIYKKAEGSKFSKIFYVIGGIIFIAASVFGIYYFIKNKKVVTEETENNIETFISYDSKTLVDTTSMSLVTDLSDAVNKIKTSGLISALFLTKKSETSSVLLTSNNFLSLIKSTAPGALTRSLSENYLLGKYTSNVVADESYKPATFIIFQTTDYNQAYASMMEWEKTMLKDLFVLFSIDVPKENNSLFEKQWKDVVINNKDARVLYGTNGEGILYYVFVNKNNFVITNNIEALKEVISRLIIKNAKM